MIDQGSFGKVFLCTDSQEFDQPVAMKFQKDFDDLAYEIKVIKRVNKVV
jgi:hypothetical protein